MINQQLVDFIKSQLQIGSSREIINKELLANGWTVQDIEEGFNAIKIQTPTPTNISPNISGQNLSSFGTQPSVGSNTIIQPQIKYAGFWIRFGAYFIDGLVLIIPTLILIAPVVFLIGVPKDIKPESINPIKNIVGAINLLISWTYFIFMTYKYQASLGKKAVGIKVFSNGFEKPTLGKVILRETIGKIVSGFVFFIGYFMIAFTQKKQGLHDKIASTVVVYNNPDKKTPSWIIAVIILFVVGIPLVLGIISSVILGSLNNARIEADLKAKEALTSTIPETAFPFEENSEKDNKVEPLVSGTKEDTIGETTPIDCAKDMNCFVSAVKNCSPSFVQSTLTANIFGMFNQINQQKLSLIGLDSAKKCIFTSNIISTSVEYTPEFKKTKEYKAETSEKKQQMLSEINKSAQMTVGMTTKCSFTETHLTDLLAGWIKGDYSSEDFASCTSTDSSGKTISPNN